MLRSAHGICFLRVTCNDFHALQTLDNRWDIPLQQVPMTKLTPLHLVSASQRCRKIRGVVVAASCERWTLLHSFPMYSTVQPYPR